MIIERGYTNKGCFSNWYDNESNLICHAIERPWLYNEPNFSCVPEGEYELVEYDSPKFGDTWCLVNHALDVGMYQGDAARYACLIHKANWVRQVKGCIAPVTKLTVMRGDWAGSSSGDAYKKIAELIEGGDTTLIITHAAAVLLK